QRLELLIAPVFLGLALRFLGRLFLLGRALRTLGDDVVLGDALERRVGFLAGHLQLARELALLQLAGELDPACAAEAGDLQRALLTVEPALDLDQRAGGRIAAQVALDRGA